MKYIEPKMEIIHIEPADIIVCSDQLPIVTEPPESSDFSKP